MAIVSSIRIYRGIVEVSVDGQVLAKIKQSFFAKLPLNEGDAVDADAYLDRMAALQFKAAYEAALTSLDFSARTAGELRASLLKKGFVEAAVEGVIERLTENRLIDDQAYAERMVQLQQNKPIGIYALKRKMRAKGLDEDVVDEAMEAVDDEQQIEAARALAKKLAPRYAGQEKRAARAKLSQALARRGFSWDVIGTVLSNMDEDFDDE